MIGINDYGQVKVWFSRNSWQQEPKTSYSYLKAGSKEAAERSMVDELKTIFRCKTDKFDVPDGFKLESDTFDGLMGELE